MRSTFGLMVLSSAFIAAAEVPFVGCEMSGQQFHTAPPNGTRQVAGLVAAAASKLAFYSNVTDGSNIGVLAPRGWFCYGFIGSSGDSLFVSPKRLDHGNPTDPKSDVLAGPAIQVTWNVGDSSARLTIGEVIARAFPSAWKHLDDYEQLWAINSPSVRI